MSKSNGFDIIKLLLGLLSVGLSYYVLTNPVSAIYSLVWIIGIFLIINGIMRFAGRNTARSLGMKNTGMMTFSAILDILFGLLVIFVPASGIAYIWIVLSMALILDSAFELFAASLVKETSKGLYWFIIIMAILGMILGFILLFNPVTAVAVAVALLGAYFLVYGIMNIVTAF